MVVGGLFHSKEQKISACLEFFFFFGGLSLKKQEWVGIGQLLIDLSSHKIFILGSCICVADNAFLCLCWINLKFDFNDLYE